jgi:hypothetical protein
MLFPKLKYKEKISLEEVTNKLALLRLPISFSITPLNLESEKEKFFNSDIYNPQFVYKKETNENEKILKELSRIKEILDVDPRISSFYVKLINDKKEANDLYNSIGNNEKLSELSTKKYGTPSDILFNNASLTLRKKLKKYSFVDEKNVNKKMLDSATIKNSLRVALDEFGLFDWKVIDSKNISKNRIRSGVKSREIYVDPDIKRSSFSTKRAIIHEIGTHTLRAYNGFLSGFDALGKANISNYIDTEEGLVLVNTEKYGYLKYSHFKNIALMTVAIKLGYSLTFRQLYEYLLTHVKSQDAFKITYRVKRGLTDTSLPGIYGRDVVYFRGFRKVKKEIEKDSSLYDKLYAGKIGIDMVNWVDDGLINKASIVPNKEIFEKIFRKAGI